MPTPMEIAISLQDEVSALVNAKLLALGVSLETDQKGYYKASRDVVKAVVGCAVQRMFSDGANPGMVYETAVSKNVGWELFLHNNPKIAAKVAKEKAENEAKLKALMEQEDEGEESSEHGDEHED